MSSALKWFVERAVAALFDSDGDTTDADVERAITGLTPESRDAISRVSGGESPALFFHLVQDPASPLAATVDTRREWDERYAYFVRIRDFGAPSSPAGDADFGQFFDFGTSVGGTLHALGEVLSSVYSPLLASPQFYAPAAPAATSPATGQQSRVADSLRSEFVGNLRRFCSHVEVAQHQLSGEVQFRIPALSVDLENAQAAAEDYQSLSSIETAVEEWTPVIQRLLEGLEKAPRGPGTLAEVNFWNDRRTALAGAYEQLNCPTVRKMVEVLELADSPNALPFRTQYNELAKQHLLAEENVKFLTTLERHFKNLAHGTIQSNIEMLPSMMSAIKMVWLISRHYSKDEHMTPLMERIAWEMSGQVQRAISVRTVLRDGAQARQRIADARSLLLLWKQTYLDVRARVEEDDPELHWEFDRRRLFEQTDFQAEICANVHDIAEVIEQFNNIPMLKAVTGNSQRIDEVLAEVRRLVAAVEAISFDIFDRRNSAAWEAELRKFHNSARDIDAMVRDFINESFQNLRSAEDAFDLLLRYKTIRTRPAINKLMAVKFADVLKRYAEEIERVSAVFKQQQLEPPIAKNQPPVAGAILWSQTLFEKLKTTITRFQAIKDSDFLGTEIGKLVSREYLKLGKAMRAYEQQLFKAWAEQVEAIAGRHLKQPILAIVDAGPEAGRITVNFHSDLRLTTRDAKFLDSLGFPVPSVALNIALQEEKYRQYTDQLGAMLASYYSVRATVAPEEEPLLAAHIRRVEEVMAPGLKTLNWTSLSIPDFVQRCNQEISAFQALISAVQIHVAKIAASVEEIAATPLVCRPTPPPGEDILDVHEFLDQQAKFRSISLDQAVKAYRSISGSLGQIESVTVPGKPTLKCPTMRPYYALWERRVFNALNAMVLRNLTAVLSLLRGPNKTPPPFEIPSPAFVAVAVAVAAAASAAPAAAAAAAGAAPAAQAQPAETPQAAAGAKAGEDGKDAAPAGQAAGPAPLFRVTASLSAPEIVLHPSAQDIEKAVSLFANTVIESSGRFVRWQDGKCIECPAQEAESDEPLVISFLSDISANPQVIRTMLSITHAAQHATASLAKHAAEWTRYRVLWKLDRDIALERFASRNAPCVAYDERIGLYSRLAAEVQGLQTERDVDFVRLSYAPLSQYIQAEASSWMFAYGRQLNESARRSLTELNAKLDKLEEDLDRPPDTMADLKFVLSVIDQIWERNSEIEEQYSDISERYRTLVMFKHPVPAEELREVDALSGRWVGIMQKARAVDDGLVFVKKRFTDITRGQVQEFVEKLGKLREKYEKSGPDTEGVTLDAGLELLAKVKASLERYGSTREELVIAEKLFSLPITSYPVLSELEARVRDLSTVYELYSSFRDAVQGWSATQWNSLDINVLVSGVEAFTAKLRRLPKQVQSSPPFRKLNECIRSFSDSIPLIRDLKSDALRPRHWQKISEITGKSFGRGGGGEGDKAAGPGNFTLDTVFKMELSKFSEQIAEVTSGAAHELTIENTLQGISSAWQAMRFEIVKYSKGTEDRGYILKGIEDIKSSYEDNMMTLQTMGLSRFVGPFTPVVQKWEKTLMLIEEVTTEWMSVQKKWLYLENIFIGNADILVRLPEEAKRFGRVDKAFKKLMTETSKNTLVVEACSADGRAELLKNLNGQLQVCQRALSEYLETKRQAFARFYFISDEELLSILGSTDINALQLQVSKLFDSVVSLKLGAGGRGAAAAAAASSAAAPGSSTAAAGTAGAGSVVIGLEAEGESVDLRAGVTIEGTVEAWMSKVEAEMKSTMRTTMKEAVYNKPKMGLAEWIEAYPSMCVLAGTQVWWTWDIEDTFRLIAAGNKQALKQLSAKLHRRMDSLVDLIRGDLTPRQRAVGNTLIIVGIHQRDVVDSFVRNSVLSADEFAWKSQLRFYWDQALDDMQIRQCQANFDYGYEYLGLSGRLVVTPLTVRCIVTLTQALSHRLGGAPAGPAGTGKTETVKDLAKQLGLLVKVYCCLSEDHQILTSKGFMSLQDVQAEVRRGTFLSAPARRLAFLDVAKEASSVVASVACADAETFVPTREIPATRVTKATAGSLHEALDGAIWCGFDVKSQAALLRSAFESLGSPVPLDLALISLKVGGGASAARDAFLAMPSPRSLVSNALGQAAPALIASYDRDGQTLLYEPLLRVVTNPENAHTHLFEITPESESYRWGSSSDAYGRSPKELARDGVLTGPVGPSSRSMSNGVSLVVTPDHDMLYAATRGRFCPGMAHFEKKPARAMECSDPKVVYKFIGNAANGLDARHVSTPRLFSQLGLDTPRKRAAFLEMYGFWLGNGTLERVLPRAIKFAQWNEADGHFLRDRLSVLGMREDDDWKESTDEEGTVATAILNKRWVKLFFDEYGHKYGHPLPASPSTSAQEHNTPESTTSAKWMACWVWGLSANDLRSVIAGCQIADGSERKEENAILTSSVSFRDELLRVLLHAGLSGCFKLEFPKGSTRGRSRTGRLRVATADCWRVCWSEEQGAAEPIVRATDVRRVKPHAGTWCVTVPHGLIVARRAEKNAAGEVTKASRPVITGNCGENVDYSTTARLLSGLVQVGAWSCFDEFNRILPEVLSVISIQISTIQHAFRQSLKRFQFFGKEMPLDPKCGIFITMNPGYAGRSELPDNLKALFRPVVMVVPDMELITEVILNSQGFNDARSLAKKTTAMYSLARQQLSCQNHYDWGLRALKSVLAMAGTLKRAAATATTEPGRASSGANDAAVLVKAIQGMNLPKLVQADIPIFKGILRDLFQGVEAAADSFATLRGAIEDCMREKDDVVIPEQVDKVIQLYETMCTRHTVMIVGPTGSSKSSIINALQAAQTKLGKPTKLFVLNPKAQSTQELYGWMDQNTRQWHDGLLSSIFREANTPQSKEKKVYKYIVFDGDVDAVWVEDMNCFPAPDHEIMTIHGFMTLQQVMAHFDAGNKTLLVACFVSGEDPAKTGRLEYHAVTRDRVHIAYGEHTLVEFGSQKAGMNRSATNHVSVQVTENHRMFAIAQPTGQRSANARSDPPAYKIIQAHDLFEMGKSEPSTMVQFLANAAAGIRLPDEADTGSFVDGLPSHLASELRLSERDQRDAFVELIGCWNASGTLESRRRCVSFCSTKQDDVVYLMGLLRRVGLTRLTHDNPAGRFDHARTRGYFLWNNPAGSTVISVVWRPFWDAFARQFGHKYAGFYAERAALEGALIRGSNVPQGRHRPAVPAGQVDRELRQLLKLGPTAYNTEQRVAEATADEASEEETIAARASALGADTGGEAARKQAREADPVAPIDEDQSRMPEEEIEQLIEKLKTMKRCEPEPPPAESPASDKWLWYWILRGLDKGQLRMFVKGLLLGDGDEAQGKNRLCMSSARYRDEVTRLLLHAGYATHSVLVFGPNQQIGVDRRGMPIVSTTNHHVVHFSDASRSAQPRFHFDREGEITQKNWRGTVWCVSVPTKDSLIVVRRAPRDENGLVTNPSRPIVIGNSVMDDSKQLTLPNGEFIKMQPWCSLLFEVKDLEYASPATVSRSGMIYVTRKVLGYEPYFTRWLKQKSSKQDSKVLQKLFEKYVPPCIRFLIEGIQRDGSQGRPPKSCVPLSEVSLIKQLCTLLEVTLAKREQSPEKDTIDPQTTECFWIFCLVWSFGSCLLEESRPTFDTFVKQLTDWPIAASGDGPVPPGAVPGKPGTTLYEYFFDDHELRWVPWAERVTKFSPGANAKFHQLLVPTSDTVRMTWLLDSLVAAKQPVLLIGESTGKTFLIQNYLAGLDREKHLQISANFSSRTTSMDLQRALEYQLERYGSGVYGPAGGKSLVVFVDDMNMPVVDKYGTQQPLALLKMLLERNGLYDRGEELTWKSLRNVQYVAAMGMPGGGRSAIDPRVVSQFNTFYVSFPSDENVARIFTSILARHFEPFHAGIREACEKVVPATIALYKHMTATLPPTPARFHYIFSLRDLARIFEGLTYATIDKFDTTAQFVRLWRSECEHVFGDRLISKEDMAVFGTKLREVSRATFPDESKAAFVDPMLFGDFKTVNTAEELRIYEDLGDYPEVRAVFEDLLLTYNEKTPANRLNLVLFDYTLEHLTRVIRIIRRPRGHALLVGVNGSGRQSITRLAAFASGYGVFEITLSRGYGDEQFRESLKDLYRQLGLENKELVFLFTDAHVVKEGFLEYVNNMLTTGIVPALFEDEEKEQIMAQMRDEAAREGRGTGPGSQDPWAAFTNRCRDNLHVVLCMSPSGNSLRQRCRNFPGLVQNVSIDWFHRWPEDALRSVADAFLAVDAVPAEQRTATVSHMVLVHQSAVAAAAKFEQQYRRPVYVTPKHFLDLVATYNSLVTAQRKSNDEQVLRLEGGLRKLIEAGEQLAELNAKLVVQKAQVEEQSRVCNELLQSIGEKKVKVEAAQLLASTKEKELQELSQQIAVQKQEAEADLAAALPVLEIARQALKDLKKEEVTEVRTFALPPKAVQAVCECLCHLYNSKTVDWKTAKAIMASPSFISDLLELNPDDLSDKGVKGIREIIRKNELSVEKMAGISRAATGMYTFIEALLNYNVVAKKVKPKRQALELAQKQEKQNEKDLENIKAEAKQLMTQIEELNGEYQTRTKEQRELKEQAELMEKRTIAAKQLISGLGTERERWTRDAENLRRKRERIAGDCLLCSSFLTYAGPFNSEYRTRLVYGEWQDDLMAKHIPLSFPLKVEAVLADDVKINQWAAEDLPPDELSIQNGLLTTLATRFPLCIDPQQQANHWIKRHEAKNQLIVRSFADSDFAKQLELAIMYGLPMLIENVSETLDPLLEPVLYKRITVAGSQKIIKLGEKEVDWNDKFKLYMTSKLPNPIFDPSAFGKTTVINYSVTPGGLQDQLLSIVLAHEHADIEQRRQDLVQAKHEGMKQLKQDEDSLLMELANATGMMLDNQELIRTLNETKAHAAAISEKLELTRSTAQDLEKIREGYRPAAKRGAILFFVLSGLASVNPMYQYSLNAYKELFQASLVQSAHDSQLAARLANIMNTLTKKVYEWTCMGLFEADKVTLSFHMCIEILRGEDRVNPRFLDFFLRGNTMIDKASSAVAASASPAPDGSRPAPSATTESRKEGIDWLSEQGHRDLLYLSALGGEFEGIEQKVAHEKAIWRQWADLEAPEEEEPPMKFKENALFCRLMLLRVFRIGRVMAAVRKFVAAELGERYTTPPVVVYQSVFEQSAPTVPVICLLSPGADPLTDITKLAERLGFGGTKLKPFALGQDQGDPAAQLVENAAARGQWVVLQNLHLLPSWLGTLEKILEKLEKPHPDFRLWLTTEPSNVFPVGILQRCLKVVTEPPNGLKMNMKGSFSKLSEEFLSRCPHPAFRSLVYVMAFFHAVLQERRRYGKVGFNVPYDFNESDQNVSLALLASELVSAMPSGQTGSAPVPWSSLRYLIGEVMYGGRVTDNMDRRILATYLEEFMGDFLFDTFQPFHFFRSDKVDYTIPKPKEPDQQQQQQGTPGAIIPRAKKAGSSKERVLTYETLIGAIDALPDVNTPDVLGLHVNAEIGYYTAAAKQLWASMLEMQPRTGDAPGATRRETVVGETVNRILSEMPQPTDVVAVERGIRGSAEQPRDLTPSEIVLLQELGHWNKLVSVMARTLDSLRKALIGEVAMDDELEGIQHSLFIGAVPGTWRRYAPQTQMTLVPWLAHFKRRAEQYRAWTEKGEPVVMWLGGLHAPEGYLTCLVQAAVRRMQWPLDKTALATRVTDIRDPAAIAARPEMGCFVSGLSLEGASWDAEHHRLVSQKPKELVVDMPIVELIPVEVHKMKLHGTFKTPVYVTQARRDKAGQGFVFDSDLPTEEHPSHWVLQGVCMVLNKS